MEAQRETKVFRQCDIVVVGGGPAGTAAAVAAARLGADVMLVERHNHLGGLATGGLVIWIDRMTDWSGRKVIAGFAEEVLDLLPKPAVAGPGPELWGRRDRDLVDFWQARSSAHHGMVTWAPTVDPEHLKLVSQQLVAESGAHLLLHSLGVSPLLRDGRAAGVFFESKEGRMAIEAKVVIDCTGDGDIFFRAGAQVEQDIDERDIHHCMNTAWLFGGIDMEAWLAFKGSDPEGYSAFMQAGRVLCGGSFERPVVSWRRDVAVFMGPRLAGYFGGDVEDLTEAETRSRWLMTKHLEHFRAHAPGFENAFIMLSAPQLGVRHTRRLIGQHRLVRRDWIAGAVHDDEVGISPSVSPKFPNVSVPYGCLIPESIDGLLAAGRHVACDASSHTFMREIPQCWLTGQAAGVGAALAVAANLPPRLVPAASLRQALLSQGVPLSPVGPAAMVAG
jgi:glycine/D-amino acid oxidase-like deaminating enzyme